MKRFGKRTLLFIVIYIIISVTISIFTPYHWGNPWFSTKIQYLETRADEKYNTYFFGSSLVYRQIAPTIFDTVLKEQGYEMSHSFNLGAPATFNPQSYYLYEQFLQSPLSKNVKYCFIELREVDLFSDYFLHQERATYWQNCKDLSFVLKSLQSNSHLSYKTKLYSYRNYLISYIENVFHLGHFGKQMTTPNFYDNRYIGENGFFPLEQDYRTSKDSKVKNNLLDRQNSIINNPEKLRERKKAIQKAYDIKGAFCDNVNLQRINYLIQKSQEKGIHLIFILSPRAVNKPLLTLSSKIPDHNIIDMANPEKFESLYVNDNSFDMGHLNTKGAEDYTRLLAMEFVKIKARTHNNVYTK